MMIIIIIIMIIMISTIIIFLYTAVTSRFETLRDKFCFSSKPAYFNSYLKLYTLF